MCSPWALPVKLQIEFSVRFLTIIDKIPCGKMSDQTPRLYNVFMLISNENEILTALKFQNGLNRWNVLGFIHQS